MRGACRFGRAVVRPKVGFVRRVVSVWARFGHGLGTVWARNGHRAQTAPTTKKPSTAKCLASLFLFWLRGPVEPATFGL